MDMSFWLDLLSTGLPSGIIMFAGLFALAIAHGGFGVKMENKSKRQLNILGFVVFISGFIFTVFIAIFQIWEKHTASVLSSLSILEKGYYSLPYKNEIILVLFVLVLIIVFRENLFEIYKDRKYKLNSEFVLNKEKDKLDILVENTSGETIECHARISKIVVDGKERNVKKYNPEGYYMKWDKGRQSRLSDYAVLTSGIQRILYFSYVYGDEIRFEIEGDEGDPLEIGKCEITIEFYRMKNNNFVKFDSFTGFIRTFLTDRGIAGIEVLEEPKYSIIKRAVRFLDRSLA